ncbi:MAG: cyclodeaminase/cyclohydrolase family protein [Ignavibacteriae bacterium]|nr:cyclodeaminase/cyclohydrolase family protein [Ignavibacteriota bacterium]
MATKRSMNGFLDELASSSPAPGGGSVAALAGALGAALTSMVCNLTIGKKKYLAVEEQMKKVLKESEDLRARFSVLIDKDTDAFNKVMEAYSLPKDDESKKALRDAAISAATKEATMVPLEVMKHCIDAMALAQTVAENGNKNSISDAGVSALMLHAACESAALNVRINLNGLADTEFVHWKSDELISLLKTSRMMLEETQAIVAGKMKQS